MSNTTASVRFPGYENNTDIRKLCTNLVPFPRLHFLMQGQAPLVSRSCSSYMKMDVPEITTQMFDPRCLMSSSDPKFGKILTASALYRG